MKVVNWLVDHWEMIFTVLTALIALASAITKLTPTPVDDNWVAFLQRMVARLSAVQFRGAGGLKIPLTKPSEAARSPLNQLDNK